MNEDLLTLVANTGFAIGVAVFLIRWVTVTLNSKLDTIIQTQQMLTQTMNEVANTQRLLVELLKYKSGGGGNEPKQG